MLIKPTTVKIKNIFLALKFLDGVCVLLIIVKMPTKTSSSAELSMKKIYNPGSGLAILSLSM